MTSESMRFLILIAMYIVGVVTGFNITDVAIRCLP